MPAQTGAACSVLLSDVFGRVCFRGMLVQLRAVLLLPDVHGSVRFGAWQVPLQGAAAIC